MHLSYIEIIKLEDPKSGVSKFGKPYTLQEAHCILRDQDGGVGEVGRLMVPRDYLGKITTGHYAAAFTLGTDREGKVTAVITDLRPMKFEAGKYIALAPLKAA